MSADANINTIKEIYDAFGRGDAGAILARLTDDVDWSADGTGEVPWYGRRSGKDGVGAFFAEVASVSEVLEFSPLSFAATDDEVHTLVRYRVRFTTTGREIDMHLHHYFRLRDGEVAYYRGSEDSAQTVAALR